MTKLTGLSEVSFSDMPYFSENACQHVHRATGVFL